MNREPVKDYVPYSWISLVNVKRQHYGALSHGYCAKAILEDDGLNANTKDILQFIHEPNSGDCKTQLDIKVPKDDYERKLLGRAHLREALMLHEESQRLQRMCRELKAKHALAAVLRATHNEAMKAYTGSEQEDDFRELLDPPHIQREYLYFS